MAFNWGDYMRILVADDQPKVRFALRVLLERQSGLEVISEAADAVDLLVQAMNACPDLVLLAWDLPGLAELDLVPALRRVCPAVVIIALSGRSEARRAALEGGVDAFVSKGDPPDGLLATIADCCPNPIQGISTRELEPWKSDRDTSTNSYI
jgi:DNA-binding NarL/FixJ family response regulator